MFQILFSKLVCHVNADAGSAVTADVGLDVRVQDELRGWCEAQAQQQVCACGGYVVRQEAQTVIIKIILIIIRITRTKTYATFIHSVSVYVVESESTGNRNLIVDCETQAGFEVCRIARIDFPKQIKAIDFSWCGVTIASGEGKNNGVEAAVGGESGVPCLSVDEFLGVGGTYVLDEFGFNESQQGRRVVLR